MHGSGCLYKVAADIDCVCISYVENEEHGGVKPPLDKKRCKACSAANPERITGKGPLA